MFSSRAKFEKIMKVKNAKELPNIGSVAEISEVIKKEVEPLMFEADNYEKLYDIVVALRKVQQFSGKDPYFVSENARYIFALTKLDGKNRNEIIGLNEDIYADKKKAQKWYKTLSKKVHPDSNTGMQEEADKAMQELQHIYNRVQNGFSSEEEYNGEK